MSQANLKAQVQKLVRETSKWKLADALVAYQEERMRLDRARKKKSSRRPAKKIRKATVNRKSVAKKKPAKRKPTRARAC